MAGQTKTLGHLTTTTGIDRSGFQRDLQQLRRDMQQASLRTTITLDTSAAGKATRALAEEQVKSARQSARVFQEVFREQETLERRAAQEGMARLRAANQTAQMNARLQRDALRQQASAENEAQQAGMARLRAANQTAQMNARLSAQAEREAQQVIRAALKERTELMEQVRLAYSRARAEYDKTAGQGADMQQKTRAAIAYREALQQITNGMQTFGQRTDWTNRELTQQAELQARIARERNTLSGGINTLGLSGNVSNAMQTNLPRFLSALQNSLGSTLPLLSQLSPSLGAAASNIGTLANAFQVAGPATGLFTNGVGGATAGVGALNAGAVAAGAGLAVFTAGVVASIAVVNKAVNVYAEFEHGLAQVATLTDKTTAQLGATGHAILKLSMDTGASFKELNAGLYDILGAGVQGTEDMAASLDLLRTSTMLAKAGATDTKTATDVLTSVLNSYKLEAADAGKVSDMLFQAVKDGKMSFDQLAMSLGMVTPIAAQAGLGLDEVLGAVAAMTAQGIRPSSAIEYLRSALSNIIKPSIQAKNEAAELGLQFDAQALKAKGLVGFLQDVITKTKGNSESMSRLVGDIGGLTAVMALSSGEFDRLKKAIDNQNNSAGATAEAYGKMAATIEETGNRISAKWTAIWAKVGELFAPMKLSVMQGIDDMLNRVDQLLDKFLKARGMSAASGEVQKWESELAVKRDEKRGALEAMKDFKNRGEAVPQYLVTALANIDNAIVILNNKIAEAKKAEADLKAAQAAPMIGPQFPAGDVLAAIGASGGRISQNFGLTAYSKSMKGKPGYEDGTHKGLDIALPTGTKLYTPGEVKMLIARGGWNDGFGTMVKMLDEYGNTILMAHLSKLSDEAVKAAKSGATLKKGTLVGLSGSSGQSDGPHLHLETRNARGGVFNPLTYGGSGTPMNEGAPTPTSDSATDAANQLRALKTLKAEYLDFTAQQKRGKMDLDAYRNAVSGLRSEAERLAATQKIGGKDWTATEKFIIQTSNALKTHEKGVKDVTLTWAQWSANREKALTLARREQQLADGKLSEKQTIQLGQDLAAYKKIPVQAAALQEAERQLAEQRKRQAQAKTDQDKADRDAETAAKNRLQTQRELADTLSKGQEADSQRLIDRLKVQQQIELNLAKDSAKKRAEITAQSGPALIAAQDQLAEVIHKRAVAAANRAAEDAKKLPGADLKAIEQTRLSAISDADKTLAAARSKARSDQEIAERQANQTSLEAQQQHEKERKRLMAQAAKEARELRYADADATLNRIKSDNKAELDAFKGSVDERVALIKTQSQAEFDAAEKVARIKRDNALRENDNNTGQSKANHDENARQIKQRYTDYVEGLKNTRIATVREATQTADDFWKAAAQDADQYKSVEDHFSRMEAAAKSAGSGVDAFVLSVEGAVNGLPDATEAQADYLKGLELLEQNGTAAAGAVLAVKEAIEQKAETERKAMQEASDLFMLDTFGGGEAGLKNALSAYGVSGIDQLMQVDPVAAEQVKRVYKSTFDQIAADLEKAVEHGQTVLENFRLDAEKTAQEIQDASETAVQDKNQTDADTVKGLSGRGPRAMLGFLQGGQFFGDQYWTKLGEDGRTAFATALNSFTPEDFAGLGQAALEGLIDKIGDNSDWADLKGKLEGGLGIAIREGISTSALDGLNEVADEFDALKTRYGDSTDLSELQTFQTQAELLLTRAEALAASAQGTSLADDASARLATLRAEFDQIGTTIENVMDSLNSGDTNKLDEFIQGIFDAGEAAREGFQNGTLGVTEYNAAITTTVDSYQQLYDRLSKLGPEYAETADQVRLLIEYFQKGKVDAAQLAAAMQSISLADAKKNASDRDLKYKAGLLSSNEMGQQVYADVKQWEQVAKNLDRVGDTKAAAKVREFIKALQDSQDPATKAAMAAARLAEGYALVDAQADAKGLALQAKQKDAARRHDLKAQLAYLAEAQQNQLNAAQTTFERETALLDEGSDDYKAAQQRLENARTRIQEEGTAARIALIQSEIEWYGQMADQVLGSLGRLTQAMAEGEQQYDKTGKALNTPWTDLGANIEGAQKGMQTALSMARDIGKLAASGGADIGAWISLATTIVSSIADALSGFKKAYSQAQQLRDDFAASNPLLNPTDFQSVRVESRGWLADTFGGGPKVINEIDKVKLPIAQTIAGGVTNGITTGFQKYLETGNMTDFSKALGDSINNSVKESLIRAFTEAPERKNEYATAIKALTDAIASGDPAQREAAMQLMGAAMQKTTADAAALAAALDEIDKRNGTGRYSPEAIAARERDLESRNIDNGLAGLKLQLDKKLITQAEYDRQSLALRHQKLDNEMAAELAATGLTEEQKAAIREKYRIQNEQLDVDALNQQKERTAQFLKDLSGLQMNNAETALGIEEKLALSTATSEEQKYQIQLEYARKRLELTKKRLEAERAADLALVDMSQEHAQDMVDAINAKYDLALKDADAELTVMQNQYASSMSQKLTDEAKQKAEDLKNELDGILKGWAGTGASAFLEGLDKSDFSVFLNKWKADLTKSTVQGILEAELGRVMTQEMTPLVERYRAATKTAGTADDLAALRDLRSGIMSVGPSLKPLFETLGPIWQEMTNSLAENTAATRENTEATKQAQFQQTTIVDYGLPLASPQSSLRARLSGRYS